MAVSISTTCVLALPQSAAAHEITIAVLTAGDDADARAGFDLAVDESPDVSHGTEEAALDHLGGLDVVVSHLLIDDARMVADALSNGTRAVAIIGTPVTASGALRAMPGLDLAFVVVAVGTSPPWPGSLVVLRDVPSEPTKLEAFTAHFQAVYGRDPSPAAARGYDAGKLLDAAIASAGETIDVSSIELFDPADAELVTTAVAAPGSRPPPTEKSDRRRPPVTLPTLVVSGLAVIVLTRWRLRRKGRS